MVGHNVVAHAFDGAEAVELFPKLKPKPQIVLMDHRMPIKDGVTTTKEIKLTDPKCKIVFLSADETARKPAFAASASGFLVKLIRFIKLLETISRLI